MKIDVNVINAFAVDGKGGNPAGVILNADGLNQKQMQTIASKLAFPESAFVSKSSVADFKLDFFTPTKQIPHCGHATIGTFTYLKKNGIIPGLHSSKETIDGTRRIFFKDGLAYMETAKACFPRGAGRISLHITFTAYLNRRGNRWKGADFSKHRKQFFNSSHKG